MDISHDRIAGTSVERLAALSDGIFGIACCQITFDNNPQPAILA